MVGLKPLKTQSLLLIMQLNRIWKLYEVNFHQKNHKLPFTLKIFTEMCSSTSRISGLVPRLECFSSSSATHPTLPHTRGCMYTHVHAHTHAQTHHHLAGSFHPSSSLHQTRFQTFQTSFKPPSSSHCVWSCYHNCPLTYLLLDWDSIYVPDSGTSFPGVKCQLCHLLPAESWANFLTFYVSVSSSANWRSTSKDCLAEYVR